MVLVPFRVEIWILDFDDNPATKYTVIWWSSLSWDEIEGFPFQKTIYLGFYFFSTGIRLTSWSDFISTSVRWFGYEYLVLSFLMVFIPCLSTGLFVFGAIGNTEGMSNYLVLFPAIIDMVFWEGLVNVNRPSYLWDGSYNTGNWPTGFISYF